MVTLYDGNLLANAIAGLLCDQPDMEKTTAEWLAINAELLAKEAEADAETVDLVIEEMQDAWYKKYADWINEHVIVWTKEKVYDPYMEWTNAREQTWLKWLIHVGAILAIILVPVLLIFLCCLCCRKKPS